MNDPDRGINTWVFSDNLDLKEKFSESLKEGHRGAADWILTICPLLIIPIRQPREKGHILRDVALISPEKFPMLSVSVFAGNDELINLLDDVDDDKNAVLKVGKLKSVQNIVDWHYEDGLHVVGIVCPEL